MKKDIPFEWTRTCHDAFNLLKKYLYVSPIPKHPNPEKTFALYTDVSKYTWACPLTQAYTHVIFHPITYVSSLFRGSQLNWAALTKEVHSIYMSVKTLLFYLDYADVTLRDDRLPLKRFFEKNALNSMVNSWLWKLSNTKLNVSILRV